MNVAQAQDQMYEIDNTYSDCCSFFFEFWYDAMNSLSSLRNTIANAPQTNTALPMNIASMNGRKPHSSDRNAISSVIFNKR